MLEINPEKVRQVIVEARKFDVKEGDSDPDSGSNGSDDGMVDVLEDTPDDAAFEELTSFIDSMDEDEQASLVALAWLGRGTYTTEEWAEALAEARRAHATRTAEYLTSLPLLGDYLEEGLAAMENDEEDEDDEDEEDDDEDEDEGDDEEDDEDEES
jgi:hypothetical protein